MFAVAEEPRVTLTVTVNREDGWLFEHARLLGKHAAGAGADETLDALLAEGTTSLLAETDRSAAGAFDASLDEEAPQRAWEQELARFRDEAESRCEARFSGKPRAVPREQHAELPWDGDAESIDAQLRWVAGELARRDLVLGELAETFWAADGWRRLGFATESQYARERLGMSSSTVKAKRALARRTRELPRLQDAMKMRDLGYEAARLVASVASRETVDSWVERARERTVKHLREEVDAAQMLGRVGVDTTMAPPEVTTMVAIAELERRIVTGEAFQLGRSQMFAVDREARTPARLASLARVALKFRVGEQTRRYYRWLERTYLRHGPRAGTAATIPGRMSRRCASGVISKESTVARSASKRPLRRCDGASAAPRTRWSRTASGFALAYGSPDVCGRPARSAMVISSSPGSTGLLRCALKPSTSARSRSSFRA
jgi:hypothetical protein